MEKGTKCSNQEWLDEVYNKLLVKMKADTVLYPAGIADNKNFTQEKREEKVETM